MKKKAVFWGIRLRAKRRELMEEGPAVKGMAGEIRGLRPRFFRILRSKLGFPFLFYNSFESSSASSPCYLRHAGWEKVVFLKQQGEIITSGGDVHGEQA